MHDRNNRVVGGSENDGCNNTVMRSQQLQLLLLLRSLMPLIMIVMLMAMMLNLPRHQSVFFQLTKTETETEITTVNGDVRKQVHFSCFTAK